MANHNTSLGEFLESLKSSDTQLASLLLARRNRLEQLGFQTVGDVWGCLRPEPPRSTGGGLRCLARGYAPSASGPAPEKRVRILARSLQLPVKTAERFVRTVEAVPKPLRTPAKSDAEWYLGNRKRSRLRSGRDYHVVEASQKFRTPGKHSKHRSLDGMGSRMGPAFDQGTRGTCVAQAGAALFGYVASGWTGVRLSRQFLYLQCKMIDGSPRAEGTYLACAMRVLSDRRLSGPSRNWGKADAGLPPESAWPYNPRPRENDTSHGPPPESRHGATYGPKRWGNLDGEVIRCSLQTGKLVNEMRAILHAGLPVLIALPLYESFNNPNSRRTGWITMPLVPGERLVGHHAMLAVGFDDTTGAFLVRNSWSTGWAPENRYGYPGHAVIPYRYFEQYGQGGYTVKAAKRFSASVPHGARLYNRSSSGHRFAGPRAAGGRRTSPARGRKRTPTKTKKRLFLFR